MMDPAHSLYHRLGGYDAVAAFVDDLLPRLIADPPPAPPVKRMISRVNERRVSARLDAVFGALSDPIRRTIVARLTQGECSVTALSEPFDVSAPAITKHLHVLESSGLITRRK